MTVKKKQELEEKVTVGGGATGVSQTAEPTGAQASLPKSNKNGDPMPKGQNPAGTKIEATSTENNTEPTGDMSASNKDSVKMKPSAASPSMKEEVTKLFDGQQVSEEFLTKAAELFEAAVMLRVDAEKAALEEAYASTLDEEVAAIREELSTKVEDYMNHTSEKWLEENQVAITSALKVELMEDFIGGLKNLFAENYMEIPAEKIDVLENLASRVEELETKLNESEKSLIEKDKLIESYQLAEIVAEVSEGMVLTQAEKLKSVAENIEYTDVDSFKAKLETIKESIIGNGTIKVTEAGAGILTENFESDEEKTPENLSPSMRNYAEAISRSLKK